MARMDNGRFSGTAAVKKPSGECGVTVGPPPSSGSPSEMKMIFPEEGFRLMALQGISAAENGSAPDDTQGLPNVVDLFAGGKILRAVEACLESEPAALSNPEQPAPADEPDRHDEPLRAALAEVEELKSRLKEVSETMETICNTLTDELKGPLRGMAGLSQLLLKENGWSMNATGKNYVERVVASATKMDRLIQDLVKYGRMSRQDLACENVSLETCVCEVVGAMAGTLAAKNATVQVERPFPQVWGNARTLRDVLAQLVDNMLLFAKAESAPCFHIRAESEESAVRLYLEENGATVLPEQAGQTFTPSEPANGNHSEVGLGIGMALVEKGMAKMGGTVNADFPPGRSSRFWIELGHAH